MFYQEFSLLADRGIPFGKRIKVCVSNTGHKLLRDNGRVIAHAKGSVLRVLQDRLSPYQSRAIKCFAREFKNQ